jgi:hypothetical protein
MKQRVPTDPPPRIGDEGLGPALAPRILARTGESANRPSDEQAITEPRKSFFRGIFVGIAIMVPIWGWLIIRFLL